MHIMLYGYAIRKAAGDDSYISALLYNVSESDLTAGYKGIQLNAQIQRLFDDFDFVSSANTLQCADRLKKNHPSLFDLSINCSDSGGTEAINVIATKERGTVFFSSLINNYSIAVFLTEIMGKELNILCGDGYAENYKEAWLFSDISNLHRGKVKNPDYAILHFTKRAMSKRLVFNANDAQKIIDLALKMNKKIHFEEAD